MDAFKNSHMWLADPLLGLDGSDLRRLFGCDSVYLRGKLVLVLADGEEPWNGAMFPAEHGVHPQLMAEWPELVEHPVLKKWLYLSAGLESFESQGLALVQEIVRGNPLLGVIPPAKKRRKSSRTPQPDGPKADERIPPHLRG